MRRDADALAYARSGMSPGASAQRLNMTRSLQEFLATSDPLSEDAIDAVLDGREENAFVDYKLEFANDEREWLEVTKDVLSFANTQGGYLAFGIKNGTYERVGLEEASVKLLSEPNNLMQKFNKWVDPPLTALRVRAVERNGKTFVVVLVPASLDQTHVVARDGIYNYPSSTPKTVLRQGTFYVRCSGANHLADSRDLDAVIDRRIQRFRSKLLQNIARVVESPAGSEVVVVRGEEGAPGSPKKFVIEDAPDAIAVKGMTFSVTPETAEQEVSAWIAINRGNPNEVPTAGTVWKWYEARKRLQLTSRQKAQVALFCLLRGVPAFYWLQECSGDEIREVLGDALRRRGEAESMSDTLAISAFLGKRFYRAQVTKLGSLTTQLGKMREFPKGGPRDYFERSLSLKRVGGKVDRAQMERDLDSIAKSAGEEWNGCPARVDQWNAKRIDCFLYAQDQYLDKKQVAQDRS